MAAPLHADDCLRCGACCVNSAENRATSYRDLLEVTPKDRELLKRPDALRRHTVTNPAGELHLKLVGDDQRCSALLGALGRSVRCAIYALRPGCCRRVQPGDAECLARRREHSLSRDREPGQAGPRR
ncbi:MAG: YkgJ family cysteine cluster protein [Deltaproteobacteria bacterium]|nr:YkgJ family cysteine cluster protein [Deltaproteobacteria bacterium]